jgi:GH24 family phage-related lysozyme (muramidase)
MERLVRAYAAKCLEDARNKAFPAKFNDFPKCVRRLIVDIMYNAGPGALIPSSEGFWPNLYRCLDQRNWKDAVKHVKPEKGQRAAWRRSLLEYAQKL